MTRKNKTYKDFGIAVEELKIEAGISYDTIAFSIQRAQSYVYGICNRRTRNLPKYEIMKEFAGFFHISPDYFYEWRLRKFLDFINENREFLDHCLRQAKRIDRKPSAKPEETIEEFEELEEPEEGIKKESHS